MPNYTVQQGDCISSIARKFHVGDWSVIFNHPNNAELKRKRKTPNVLFPGDVVFIPDPAPTDHPAATGKSHKFQVRTAKKLISIIVEDHEDRVLANMDYTLVVGSETDPWMPLDEARTLGQRWNSAFVNLGDAGHINTAAGFGPWPLARHFVETLARRVSPEVEEAHRAYG